jgi:hypothetical protein
LQQRQQAARSGGAPAAPRRTRVLLVGDRSSLDTGDTAAEPSLPGLLRRRYPGVAIVDTCRTGACVADVAQALARGAPGANAFDVALVLLGSNDVVQLTPRRQLVDAAAALLQELHWHARHIVWLGSADAGPAAQTMPPLGWWAGRHRRATMRALAHVARTRGVTFIDYGPTRRDPRSAGSLRTSTSRGGLRPAIPGCLESFNVLEQRVPLHAWLSDPSDPSPSPRSQPCR